MKTICNVCFICLFFIVFTGCGTGHDFTDILKATSETDTLEEVVDLSNCVEDINRSKYFGTINIELREDCLVNYIDKQILEYDTIDTPNNTTDTHYVVAAFASADPANGGYVPSNGSIKVTFDKNPGTVEASTGTVLGAGTSRTISGPFDVGSLALTVTWTNGDGSRTLNYTVTEADETAPEVASSNPEDGAKNLDPAKVFEDGITVTFNESVTGSLALMVGDTDVGWTSSTDGDTITLIGNAGQELSNETAYTVMGTVEDGSGNSVDVEISFTTKPKE